MKTTLLTLFLFLALLCCGQKDVYLGFEVGPKFNQYKISDTGSSLSTDPQIIGPIYGITIGKGMSDYFSLETGLFVNTYGEGVKIDGGIGGVNTSVALTAIQIPMRLKVHLNLIENRLRLTGNFGVTVAFNADNGLISEGISVEGGNSFYDAITIVRTKAVEDKAIFGLLETGVSIDFKMKNEMCLYIGGNFVRGFGPVFETEAIYQINSEPEEIGIVSSEGDYFSFVFGLNYPLNRLIRKK